MQSIARLRQADHALGELRDGLKPLDSTESQLRAFRQVFDAIPWSDVRETLPSQKLETPTVPAYSDFVDRSVAGQEDLLIALTELFTAPTARHVFAFALAAFIDVLVFLLAYAAGPFFFGASEDRWLAAGAALDSVDDQVFLRDLVRKLVPSPQGLARVDGATLSPGELQLFLLLTAKGLAARSEGEGKLFYLLDQSLHQRMVESLAVRGLSLHANPQPARRPSWYLVSTEDRMIPPDAQRGMSKRAGSTVVEVKGSHAVYVSQPQAVASLIAKAAANGAALATR